MIFLKNSKKNYFFNFIIFFKKNEEKKNFIKFEKKWKNNYEKIMKSVNYINKHIVLIINNNRNIIILSYIIYIS